MDTKDYESLDDLIRTQDVSLKEQTKKSLCKKFRNGFFDRV